MRKREKLLLLWEDGHKLFLEFPTNGWLWPTLVMTNLRTPEWRLLLSRLRSHPTDPYNHSKPTHYRLCICYRLNLISGHFWFNLGRNVQWQIFEHVFKAKCRLLCLLSFKYFSQQAFEEYHRIFPCFSWNIFNHIGSDAFRRIGCERKYLMDDKPRYSCYPSLIRGATHCNTTISFPLQIPTGS